MAKKEEQINVKFKTEEEKAMYQQIRKYCFDNHISLAEFLREAMIEKLQKK
jgi:hypothetical protein